MAAKSATPSTSNVPAAIMEVRQHLMRCLGQPASVAEFKESDNPSSAVQRLEVAMFNPSGKQSTTVFVTCGASQFAMADGRRVEGLLMVKPTPHPERLGSFHGLLAAFATYAERHTLNLKAGDVIQAPDDVGLVSNMAALALLPPIPFVKEFSHFTRSDGQEVEFLWLVPVHEEEAKFALEQGSGKLMQLFGEQDTDLAKMNREPVSLTAGSGSKPTAAKPAPAKPAPAKPAPSKAAPSKAAPSKAAPSKAAPAKKSK